VPRVRAGNASVWAQYTVRLPDGADRDDFVKTLRGQGIPTMVYYERPMHQQSAYRCYPTLGDGLPVSEKLASQVVSLPMHPHLGAATQDYIIENVRRALRP
jgi:dTDP-4-amino-4,6-dideoxygalactose transaminase